MGRVYALLVGINDYQYGTAKLAGCLNDVDHFEAYLRKRFGDDLDLLKLTDAAATRGAIIDGFRRHLTQAGKDDVALFHYCGHGAQSVAAPEFNEFYSEGLDEGLVCYDSRAPGGHDLADKELAVLIADVARNDPHIAILLDCCHSGSGTRDADDFRGLVPRLTTGLLKPRLLSTYLADYWPDGPDGQPEGYFQRLARLGQSFSIPTGRHGLLAACDRKQTAKEAPDRSGVFTSTLLEVLDKSGGGLNYPDLFARCRAAVRTRADAQEPQFEPMGGFNPAAGFLGGAARESGRRYRASFENGGWQVECGAVHGLPADAEAPIPVTLYPENDPARAAGAATITRVGAQASPLALQFEPADTTAGYRAVIPSLAVAPLLIRFDGPPNELAEVQQALDQDGGVAAMLTDAAEGPAYILRREGDALAFRRAQTDVLIQSSFVEGGRLGEAAARMAPAMAQAGRWERGLALQNRRTRLNTSLVNFVFRGDPPGPEEGYAQPAEQVIVSYAKQGGEWPPARGKLQVRNLSPQTLHVALLRFTPELGVEVLYNNRVERGDAYVTLWGADPEDGLFLEDGQNVAHENLRLLVTTERVDDFLLQEDDLELGRLLRPSRGMSSRVRPDVTTPLTNEWFTKPCHIKIVRRVDEVGREDTALAGGQIVIKGHPTVTADLALGPVKTQTRSVGDDPEFYRAFERANLSLVNFTPTRGEDTSVLELRDIQGAEDLATNPLQLQLNVGLADNEAILPLTFDGRHLLLAGESRQDEAGNTHVTIDHLPPADGPTPDGVMGARSVGGALKLYFLKTYLAQSGVSLRWVEFKPDGTFERRKDDVAGKVADARNILLLVHGIIGDTDDIAAGVQAAGLHDRFDLVLTFDYENLKTEIGDTAKILKAELANAGLAASHGKRLTVLAHSMGGLVTRAFIEQNGGAEVVDHLVMCGTPNSGSPLGHVESARKILNMLTTVALNFCHGLTPFLKPWDLALGYAKNVTVTLGQMRPGSEFIEALNRTPGPPVRYTILAGDVDDYQEPTDPFFAQLIVKAGRSAVFDAVFSQQRNDIAVGVGSILTVGGRAPAQVKANVACHHLNYFSSRVGQDALNALDWG